MHEQRLLNVAKACRESPAPDKFDMNAVTHACGTPGCALGHYVARTDLQTEFRPIPPGHAEMGRYGTSLLLIDGKPRYFTAREVTEHFGLDGYEFNLLFGMNGCADARTPLQAAEYIERFVAERK